MGHGMERSLGLGAATSFSIVAMLGLGVFVLPGLTASITGPSVGLAYLIAALCVLPGVLSKAELATAMPTSGGAYVYISRAFGPLSGTVAGLGLWLSLLFKSAFALVGLSAYLKAIAPSVDIVPAALGILLGVTLMNIFGMRAIKKVQAFVVAAAMIFLLFLAGASVPDMESARFEPFFNGGITGLLEAAAFVTVAYAGVTKIAAIAEEVRDPGRNLPLAMLISLGIATLVYVIMSTILVGVLDLNELGQGSKVDAKPMFDLSVHVWGNKEVMGVTAGALAGVLGILTMAAMANAGLMASSRFPFAMSRDRLLPPLFQRIHPRLLTPHTCILATGAAMALSIVFLDVEKLAKLASAFKILLFVVMNVTVIVYRRTRPDWYQPKFRSPLFPWIQGIGILVGLALLSRLGMLVFNAAFGVAVLGVAVYVLYARPEMRRRELEKKLSGRDSIVVKLVDLPPVVEEAHFHQATSLTLLVGKERTPERLVELGAALAVDGHQEVVHMIEVPEQTDLDAFYDDTPEFEALRRRVDRVADERNLDVEMDGLVTHDIDATIPHVIEEVGCQWAVVEWAGPAHHNFMQPDKHWSILEHAECNLALYRDDGVQEIRSILVYAEPDLYDDLVARAADSIAKLFEAELTFVRCVADDMDPVLELAQVDYMDQLRGICTSASGVRIVKSSDPMNALTAISKDYDLLIMATDRPRPFANFMRKSPKDYLTEDAHCSVLRLKPQDQIVKELPFDPDEDARLSLVNVLDSEIIEIDCRSADKKALFTEISKSFGARLNISPEKIEKAFWEHEMEHNTSVGDGAALPHATIDELAHETMGVFLLHSPIDYEAKDERFCDVFVAILSSPEERHAHLLLQRQLSRFVMDADLIPQLRGCSSPSEIHALFEQIGQNLGLGGPEK